MNPDDVSLLFPYMQRLAAPAVYSVLRRGAVRFGWAASMQWAALPAADRQISSGPDCNIYHSRKVHALKQMHVGIGKLQRSQSIVVEDNAITTKRAAKLNLFDSIIWFTLKP